MRQQRHCVVGLTKEGGTAGTSETAGQRLPLPTGYDDPVQIMHHNVTNMRRYRRHEHALGNDGKGVG